MDTPLTLGGYDHLILLGLILWSTRGSRVVRRLQGTPEADWPRTRRRFYARNTAFYAMVVALTVLYWVGSGRPLRLLGLGRFEEALGAMAGVAFVATVLVGRAAWRRPGVAAMPARAPAILPVLPRSRDDLTRWIGMAVGAAVSEELLFRGFGIWYLAQWDFPEPAGLYLTSALFGLAHLYQGWRGVAASTVLGMFFGSIYLGVGSLLPSMAMHFAIDLTVGVTWQRALAAGDPGKGSAPGNVEAS